ncbi:CoA-binding protein [Halanaerobium sp. Z-7514]|uniref:CoA-binding protein n=1 Tax=Halanaerobium polyolivorans TaxID=2886943 RepID=A0AAW4X0F6_9FIRM|nr:CoA-binding protein [Halanaerobium polyolivorans]MCC3145284.1 CoA-binding protein [Halanaerobium polyolivorans]RQD73896.1 MAG: CoA-binding protein [Halanaerobium sp. MSAO_Bac5]
MNDKAKTLEMKNWAVVGATDKKNKFGYKIYKKLKKHNYNVYPVNPNLENIDGDKCYAALASIPAKIEVVDMVVNPKIAIKIMENIKAEGIEYVWLQPGTRSSQIRSFAKNNNINLIESCILRNLD